LPLGTDKILEEANYIGLDLLNTGTMGSNPAWIMDVCPRFSVLSC